MLVDMQTIKKNGKILINKVYTNVKGAKTLNNTYYLYLFLFVTLFYSSDLLSFIFIIDLII